MIAVESWLKFFFVFPSALFGAAISIKYFVNMSSSFVFAADGRLNVAALEYIDNNEELQTQSRE